MKRIKFFVIACVMSVPMALHAEEMPWLTFQMKDGTSFSVESRDLTIDYVAGDLKLTSPIVNETIAVEKLKSMKFTSVSTGIEQLICNEGEDLKFFSSAGLNAGTFTSLDEARENLPSGIYVVKSGEKSIKVIF